jgi:hypothetical protein
MKARTFILTTGVALALAAPVAHASSIRTTTCRSHTKHAVAAPFGLQIARNTGQATLSSSLRLALSDRCKPAVKAIATKTKAQAGAMLPALVVTPRLSPPLGALGGSVPAAPGGAVENTSSMVEYYPGSAPAQDTAPVAAAPAVTPAANAGQQANTPAPPEQSSQEASYWVGN